jgi:hypothetical protein
MPATPWQKLLHLVAQHRTQLPRQLRTRRACSASKLAVLSSYLLLACSQSPNGQPASGVPQLPAAGRVAPPGQSASQSNPSTAGMLAAAGGGTPAGLIPTAPTSPSTGTAGTGPASPGTPNAGTPSLPPAAAQAGAMANSAGAAANSDPNSATIRMDEFTIEPGAEVFMCQDFDNPFGGVDVAVGRSESVMTPGSHHLHVYYGNASPTERTATPCKNPNEFHPMIHLATIPHQVSEYPAGTAAKLKGSTGLRFQSHYVNITDKPIRASVTLTLTKVDPASVTRWVAQMHFNRIALSIPPGSGQQVTTSCTIPANFGPIGLLSAVSHMHKHGVHFSATTSSGLPLLETSEWDEAPPMDYPQPVMLNPGDAISWTCTYDNDTQAALTYGDSALKNEMCIYIARFFSSPSGDDLECETPLASAMARSTKNIAGQ